MSESSKPGYYNDQSIRPIDFIYSVVEHNPNITPRDAIAIYNIIKYLSRMGMKGSKYLDIEKASYFMRDLEEDNEQV